MDLHKQWFSKLSFALFIKTRFKSDKTQHRATGTMFLSRFRSTGCVIAPSLASATFVFYGPVCSAYRCLSPDVTTCQLATWSFEQHGAQLRTKLESTRVAKGYVFT